MSRSDKMLACRFRRIRKWVTWAQGMVSGLPSDLSTVRAPDGGVKPDNFVPKRPADTPKVPKPALRSWNRVVSVVSHSQPAPTGAEKQITAGNRLSLRLY